VRTAINTYSAKLEKLREDQMFDVAIQRDLARECILEVDSILGVWRVWKRAKK